MWRGLIAAGAIWCAACVEDPACPATDRDAGAGDAGASDDGGPLDAGDPAACRTATISVELEPRFAVRTTLTEPCDARSWTSGGILVWRVGSSAAPIRVPVTCGSTVVHLPPALYEVAAEQDGFVAGGERLRTPDCAVRSGDRYPPRCAPATVDTRDCDPQIVTLLLHCDPRETTCVEEPWPWAP